MPEKVENGVYSYQCIVVKSKTRLGLVWLLSSESAGQCWYWCHSSIAACKQQSSRTVWFKLCHEAYFNEILNIEAVQRRATKILPVPGKKNMSYPDHLRALQLPTLIYRRLRSDYIQVYCV